MRPVVAILCIVPAVLVAQEPSRSGGALSMPAGHTVPVPSATAVRRSGPVKLDALLNEEAWKAAPPITEFTQFDPDAGMPASQRTEVRFLFDDEALYVGAKMYDSEGA